MQPFIALTDQRWFEFLSSCAENGIVDEVNFWSPESPDPLKKFAPGEPIFFRLKKPHYAIVGYGFFAHFHLFDLDMAWELFDWKNGDPDKLRFFQRIGEYRGVDLLDPARLAERKQIGCTILRDARFWPASRWIPWGEEMGWAPNVVRGKTEKDPRRVEILLRSLSGEAPSEFKADAFAPLEADERIIVLSKHSHRIGQGTFRARLLDVYDGSCAITGEHTEPVLDAAHIQPYLGPRSNHIQNGLLLTKEFHALFDLGYVTVTPDYVIRISPRLHADWKNGRRYLLYDGKPLVQVPRRNDDRPNREVLAWHNKRVFRSQGA